jgi:hypothetical protein
MWDRLTLARRRHRQDPIRFLPGAALNLGRFAAGEEIRRAGERRQNARCC